MNDINFKQAFDRLIAFEGGYVNDRTDKGGETYKGIARNFNPNLELWKRIDSYKGNKEFLSLIKEDGLINTLVMDFYRVEYWERLHCNAMPFVIAEELFEQAVNFGINQAIKHLQITLNLLNNNQKYYGDIIVDGDYGLKTLNAMTSCFQRHSSNRLPYNILNYLQGARYIALMQRNVEYEKYIGWFERIGVIA